MKLARKKIQDKFDGRERLKILFINDVGFQHGAGVAHLRQIQSFLLMGHDVKALCWMQGSEEATIPVAPPGSEGKWLGMQQLPESNTKYGYEKSEVIASIIQEVVSYQPDVVVVGNLHGAEWPLELFLELKNLNTLVIAYMHDFFFASGGCSYPGTCRLYESRCDKRCPTAHEYPLRKRSEIAEAWELRRRIFSGPGAVPLVANSYWTAQLAKKTLGMSSLEVIYLGLDEKLFSPIDKKLVRRLLGLPEDAFVVLGGSMNMNDRRKGGHIFRRVVKALSKEVVFLVFGAKPPGTTSVRTTGVLHDYRKMPLLYNAADLFLGTAIEEAFGQTLSEASACGVPIVAFNVGGVPEVARQNINARLAGDISTNSLLNEVRYFMSNPHERDKYGNAGRRLVEAEFSLRRQGERWMQYLAGISPRA